MKKKSKKTRKRDSKKMSKLTIHFIPYKEIAKLSSIERIKKLLKIILDNKLIVLQGKLNPEEETRLIEDTMIMIGNIKGFKGIELAVISPGSTEKKFFEKIKLNITNALLGYKEALTIIGPATIVKEMKKDPKKLEIMMR